MILDEKAAEAGVTVRFFTRLIDVDRADGHINGVVTHDVEGYKYVRAKTFVDATGDAVLSVLAGAEYFEAGRDSDGIMPPTVPALFANVDWTRDNTPTQTPGCVALIEKAYEAGDFEQCDRHLVGISRIGETVGYLNGGHIFGASAVKVKDVSEAMATGRRIAQQNLRFLRGFSPACENMELVSISSILGVRESRRVKGAYELNIADYMARRQFPDQIAVFNKYVDTHPYDTDKQSYEKFIVEKHKYILNEGEFIGLPYGILVPRGFDNLWVAGRCASADVMTAGSIRVMPAAAMMGQAAGTAAAQAAVTGETASGLDTARLVTTLRENGAYLPQQTLSKTLTKSEH
ncbi:hypothetical protein FACS189492_1200 [Clostridia bacterium]|nr:hypothetical protein FACS189492_1200 [Clostridia bacterium]